MRTLNALERTLAAAIAATLLLFSPIQALADGAYDLHSIIYGTQFYDPNDCTGTGGGTGGTSGGNGPGNVPIDTSLPGGTPAMQVMIFLVTHMKYTPEQAAGFAGNFQFESGFRPTATNPNGGAHGLAQWLGGRLNGPQGLYAFASNHHLQPDTLATQLNFVVYELTTDYAGMSKTYIVPYPHDLKTANFNVYKYYEGPNDGTDGARLAMGQQILRDYNKGHGGGSGTTGNGGSSCGSSATTGNGQYVSPFCNGTKTTSDRIDQGVDYSSPKGGDICAMGASKVLQVIQPEPAWAGYVINGWITYRLTDGPAKGLIVYMSEDCTISVHANDNLKAGQVICHMVPPGPRGNVIETGWAQEPSNGDIAMAHYWYVEGMPTIYGQNFSAFVKSTGGPPGDITLSHGPRDTHTLPNNCPNSDPHKCWPTWK